MIMSKKITWYCKNDHLIYKHVFNLYSYQVVQQFIEVIELTLINI